MQCWERPAHAATGQRMVLTVEPPETEGAAYLPQGMLGRKQCAPVVQHRNISRPAKRADGGLGASVE